MVDKLLNLLRGSGSKAPSLDAILHEADKHLANFNNLVLPTPEAKPRTPFDSGLPKEKMSMMNISLGQRLKFLSRGLPLFLNMQKSARMYDGKFKASKTQASSRFFRDFEELALRAGAKDLAYVKIPRNAIFQGKGIPHEYAIVFTVEMQKAAIDTSPSFESQYEVIRGYKNLAIIGNKLARFMHKNGFAAYPGTALGGITDYPHLAELAGLGAIGYHGLLISQHEGARLRINTIYTNITNLPIKADNEHLWVRDFCAMCKKCVRSCPVNAIFQEPQPRGDGGMQCIEHKACRDYFTQNFGCAVCLKVCPFSQVGYEKVKAKFKGNKSAPQFRIPLPVSQEAL